MADTRPDLIIRIKGIRPYNGEYPILDFGSFKLRELNIIKQQSGYTVKEWGEAFQRGDVAIGVAFAIVALRRAGHTVHEDALWDADSGCIELDFGADVEGDAVPPPMSSGEPGTTSTRTSEPGEPDSEERPATSNLTSIGRQPSDTGVTYDPAISAI